MFPKPNFKPSMSQTGLNVLQQPPAAESTGRSETLAYRLTLQPKGIHSLARLSFEITVLSGSAWISHNRNDIIVKACDSVTLGASEFVTIVSAARTESLIADVRVHGHPDDIAAIKRAFYEHIAVH